MATSLQGQKKKPVSTDWKKVKSDIEKAGTSGTHYVIGNQVVHVTPGKTEK